MRLTRRPSGANRGTTLRNSSPRNAYALAPPPPTLPSLVEEDEEPAPSFRPPTEADLEPAPVPSIVAALRPSPSLSSGVICFQRSRPGAPSPEILVHVNFDPVSNRGAETSSFSGMPLAPPSVNGWSARDVIKSSRDYVAITPRVRQRVHQAVDRNPWAQVSEETDPFSKGLDRSSVAVWVVNLTPAASYDLLDFRDTDADGLPLPRSPESGTAADCRWIPSTTALAVDTHGGLRRAQRVNGIRQTPPKAKRPSRPYRASRGGRSDYDQAMRSHGNGRPTYRAEMRVYALAPSSSLTTKWGTPSNRGRRGCGNMCHASVAPSSHAGSSNHADARPTDSTPEPPRRAAPTPPAYRARPVPLPHLKMTPPLAIHRWHVRMEPDPPSPMVPCAAVIAALAAEHQTAKLFASTTPASPAPTIVDIMKKKRVAARDPEEQRRSRHWMCDTLRNSLPHHAPH